METGKQQEAPKTVEDLNKLRDEAFKAIGDAGKLDPEMRKMLEQVNKLAGQAFAVKGQKTCLINGRRGKKTLLGSGAVLVEFVEKEAGQEFYDA